MAYLIDTVTLSQFGDIRRIADGTAIEPCHAVYEESVPLYTRRAVSSDGSRWAIDLFGDGSRRLYVVGPNGESHPLSGYPLGRWEYVEDVEGVPSDVLDALDHTVIPRVRGRAADRVYHFLQGRGGEHIAPAVRVTRTNGLPVAAVYADGSIIHDGIPCPLWRVGLYFHRDIIRDLVVSEVAPGHEDLGRAVRLYIECHGAALRKQEAKAS